MVPAPVRRCPSGPVTSYGVVIDATVSTRSASTAQVTGTGAVRRGAPAALPASGVATGAAAVAAALSNVSSRPPALTSRVRSSSIKARPTARCGRVVTGHTQASRVADPASTPPGCLLYTSDAADEE